MSKITETGKNLIFLISQPRAGSTLTQKILGCHSQIHTISEPWMMLHPLYALKHRGYQAEYQSDLAFQGLENTLNILPNGKDVSHISIYKREVPEPLTILGAGAAISFGTAFKRKLGKGNKNDKKA